MDDRRRDGGTNFILRIKEQETRLTIHEHDDDDDDDDIYILPSIRIRLGKANPSHGMNVQLAD